MASAVAAIVLVSNLTALAAEPRADDVAPTVKESSSGSPTSVVALSPRFGSPAMFRTGEFGFSPVIDVLAEYVLAFRKDDLGKQEWFHEFELPRALAGAVVRYESASASVVMETVRSTSGGSLIGLAGDSIVMRARTASVAYEAYGLLRIEGGLVPTLTIPVFERATGLRALGPTGLERTTLGTPADLGATCRAELPRGFGFVGVGAFNGQGYAGRELNRGKNVEVAAAVRPFAGGPEWVRPVALHATFVGGSNGTSRARADRVTAAVGYARREASALVAVTYGMGLADDGARRAMVLDAVLRVEPLRDVGLMTGVQMLHFRRNLDVATDRSTSLTGFVGYRLVQPLEILLAVDHQVVGDAAIPTLPTLEPWRVRTVLRFHPE